MTVTSNRWRAVLLVFAGILIGSVIGPSVARAATSLVTIQGAGSANQAKVSSSGRLLIDAGTVRISPPTTLWNNSQDVGIGPGSPKVLEGPTASAIDLSSLSVSLIGTTGSADVRLRGYRVASTATDCSGAIYDRTLWHIPQVTAAAPFSVSFPIPLQWRAPSGKACLEVDVNFGTVTFNASGSLGG